MSSHLNSPWTTSQRLAVHFDDFSQANTLCAIKNVRSVSKSLGTNVSRHRGHSLLSFCWIKMLAQQKPWKVAIIEN